MYVYNITTKVENEIVEEWLQWQKEIHIPEILATGFFYEHRFFKLLEQDENEGITFVIQYFAMELSDYKEYINFYAPLLREKAFLKWGNRFISFRTLLKSLL
jgi:Domain of unknown function (DUF4286)